MITLYNPKNVKFDKISESIYKTWVELSPARQKTRDMYTARIFQRVEDNFKTRKSKLAEILCSVKITAYIHLCN
jgi:hypothetical protein